MTAERVKVIPKTQWARQFLRDRLERCPWVYVSDRQGLRWYLCNYDLGVRFYASPVDDPNWELWRSNSKLVSHGARNV
tara:strand:+ start:1226 stop:1459 length:234 start_codon:yes stop_codon:yes gene_type:complete